MGGSGLAVIEEPPELPLDPSAPRGGRDRPTAPSRPERWERIPNSRTSVNPSRWFGQFHARHQRSPLGLNHRPVHDGVSRRWSAWIVPSYTSGQHFMGSTMKPDWRSLGSGRQARDWRLVDDRLRGRWMVTKVLATALQTVVEWGRVPTSHSAPDVRRRRLRTTRGELCLTTKQTGGQEVAASNPDSPTENPQVTTCELLTRTRPTTRCVNGSSSRLCQSHTAWAGSCVTVAKRRQ